MKKQREEEYVKGGIGLIREADKERVARFRELHPDSILRAYEVLEIYKILEDNFVRWFSKQDHILSRVNTIGELKKSKEEKKT